MELEKLFITISVVAERNVKLYYAKIFKENLARKPSIALNFSTEIHFVVRFQMIIILLFFLD